MKAVQLAIFAILLPMLTPYSHSGEVVMVNIGPSPAFMASARIRGLAEATRDIHANRLYGYYLSPFGAENQDIRVAVLEKYHVYGKLTSCISFPGNEEYDKAYDDAIAEEIARRYGEDFWERIDREVEQEIMARNRTD